MPKIPKESYKHISIYHQDQVLAEIRKHIGQEMPTNGEIGAALGLKKAYVANALSALVGRSILHREEKNRRRSFTIVETGETTLPGRLRDRSTLCRRAVDKDVSPDTTTQKMATPMYRDTAIRKVLKPI